MFKRNPDAVALVVISCVVLVAGLVPWVRAQRHRPATAPQLIHYVARSEVKNQIHRTVASLKQCLHTRSNHRPASRPL